MAKLSQCRTSKKQKVLQRLNPFVSETFVSFGLLAGAPALETDVKPRQSPLFKPVKKRACGCTTPANSKDQPKF
jgi:hypothetical protein